MAVNIFSILRLVAWVKRLAIAAERGAEALETLADLTQKDWAKKNVRVAGKKTEIESFDYEGANERWKQYLISKGMGETKT